MKRRSFLVQALGTAGLVGGGLWLKDNVLWRKPSLSFGAGGSGWLKFAERQTVSPTVMIELMGRPVKALLDTGAQYSVIDKGLFDHLELGEGFPLPLIAYGVGGTPQAGRGVSLDLTIGQLQVPRLRTAILDLGPLADPDGLGAQVVLGQDLFAVTVMDLDLRGRHVRLLDPETFAPASGLQEVAVNKKGTAMTSEVSLEGAVIQAVIDTGFTDLLALSTSAATTAGLLDGREETSGSSIVLGGMAKSRLVRAQTLTFDRQMWRDAEVQVFEDRPLPNYPDALIGMAAFERRRVALDLGRGRLFQQGELDLTVG